MDATTKKAILINNLVMSYDSKAKILNGLDMNVDNGCIYGLLGPSGCGKTTLLKCILGFLKPKNGTVNVFGYESGAKDSGVPGPGVGFMPQELALHGDLTVYETLRYFGKVYHMDTNYLENRIDYLVDYLFEGSIKKADMVGKLSGGQKRRISLAAAMIHEPRLLLLDEPTVGIDPVLTSKIWQKLTELAENEKVTIIITTHYIEEARKANKIGFMRSGKILEEGHPDELMVKYNATKLEDVFYKLAYSDDEGMKSLKLSTVSSKLIESTKSDNNLIEKQPFINKFNRNLIFSWISVVWIITWKKSIQLLRHPEFLLAILFMPVGQLVTFEIFVDDVPKNLNIIVINEDNPANLSSIFLSYVNKNVLDLNYKNISEFNSSLESMKRRESYGILHIKKGFSTYMIKRLFFMDEEDEDDENWIDLHNTKDNPIIESSTLILYCDVTDYMIKETIETAFKFALNDSFYDILSAVDKNPFIKPSPRNMDNTVRGSYDLENIFGIGDQFYPKYIFFISMFSGLFCGFLAFHLEKSDEMFERNQALRITNLQLIVGIFISHLLYLLIQSLISIALFIFYIQNEFNGSILLTLACQLMIILYSVISGVFLSYFLDNTAPLASLGIPCSNYVFGLSGIFWPLESIPNIFKPLVLISPVARGCTAVQRIIQIGDTFTDHRVVSYFTITGIWVVVLSILIAVVKPSRGKKD